MIDGNTKNEKIIGVSRFFFGDAFIFFSKSVSVFFFFLNGLRGMEKDHLRR